MAYNPLYYVRTRTESERERESGLVPQPNNKEVEANSRYLKTAQYGTDQSSLQAYTRTQAIIFGADADLSAYRIRYENVPHVVVLGLKPPVEVDQKLGQALADGKGVELPAHIIQALSERRIQAKRIGPWVEGHYRPGKSF